MHKSLLNSILAGLLVGFVGAAVANSTAPAPTLMLGVSEGVAEQASFAEMQEKYRPLAEALGKALKVKVVVEPSQNFKSAISSLEKGRYDLMFVRPSNIAGRAIRDNHYQLVGMAKGDFTASFIVRANHPFKNPNEVLDKRIAMPEEGALMTKAGLATLRDMGASKGNMQVRYSRYQEAVAFMVEQNFADVGVVAPAVAKAWEKKGGVVLFKSKKLPFWSVIASDKLSPDQVTAMQKVLLDMEATPEGQATLKKIGVKGWVPGNGKDYVDLLGWIDV